MLSSRMDSSQEQKKEAKIVNLDYNVLEQNVSDSDYGCDEIEDEGEHNLGDKYFTPLNIDHIELVDIFPEEEKKEEEQEQDKIPVKSAIQSERIEEGN